MRSEMKWLKQRCLRVSGGLAVVMCGEAQVQTAQWSLTVHTLRVFSETWAAAWNFYPYAQN